MPLLEEVSAVLEEGRPARSAELTGEQRQMLRDLHLISMKPQIYVCNVDEEALHEDNRYVREVRDYAPGEDARILKICGKLEAEIAALETEEEREEFLADAGLEESGMNRLIHTGYEMLGLRTFFTAGPKEVRAWTFREGALATEAAGIVHTDFQRGFIKAEVYHCEDLFELGSEQKVREAGRLRIEGKEYRVRDGDVLNFKFNV
jgi:GTP-binding protein YchF